jgi:hypothetical protein
MLYSVELYHMLYHGMYRTGLNLFNVEIVLLQQLSYLAELAELSDTLSVHVRVWWLVSRRQCGEGRMQSEEVGILLVSDDASQPATGQWLVSDWSVTGPVLD